MTPRPLTDRDLTLIEVALESAAQACQSGATLTSRRELDPLAREYLTALHHVQQLRDATEPEKGVKDEPRRS